MNPPVPHRHRPACLAAILALIPLSALCQPALEAPFTRITTGAIATNRVPSIAPAWGDFNNDGWLDLFVGNQDYVGMTNLLFLNNGDGTFQQVTDRPVATDRAGSAHAAAWADYDNDGWLDLFVVSLSDARNAVYHNAGNGIFVRMTAAGAGPPAADTSSVAAAWADYDGDGRLDLFVANGALIESRPDWLYHNEGGGRFARVRNAITIPSRRSMQGSWCDFDNDGDPDLLVTHSGDQGKTLFRNDGSGQFVDVSAASGLTDRGDSAGAAWGDYDNDGDQDLLITNRRKPRPNTRNFLYRNRGDGTFERITMGALAEDLGHFHSVTWVDYDNDGWLDVFLTVPSLDDPSPTSVKNRLYRNQGDDSFALVTQGRLVTDGGDTAGAAWGDYNNDGFPDVFVCFGAFTVTNNALYRNNGNSNNWIKVRCVGTVSNRSAIGTKVRVKATIGGVGRWQLREILGSEGWLSFNSLDVIVGLGDATVIDTLRVEWPSGIVQELHQVPVRQTLTLVERTDLGIAARDTRDFQLTLKGPRQQRYRVEASDSLTAWSAWATVTITNADGSATLTYTPAANERLKLFRALPE
ncbi:MAG TPA: CRTAC1 family protein [Verrucomicrobiota bacterium]|nr:CRTAC1 family protein [Verrucomicrobiota bacterium]